MRICFFLKTYFLVIFLCLATIGYSQTDRFVVDVNSIGEPISNPDKTYYLKLGNSVTSQIDDIENRTYIKLVTDLLSAKGYKRVIDTLNNSYRYSIVFDFSLSDSIERVLSRKQAVYGQPTKTVTNVNINTTGKPGTTTNTSNSNITPYGAVFESNQPTITGFETTKETIIQFSRKMSLVCFENTANQPSKKVWFVDTNSEGRSDDLREILPILVFASKEFIESDSKVKKSILIKSSSKELKKFLAN